MKLKTIKEIVDELRALGHQVETYQRTDVYGRKRGMLIRRIDGSYYKGSTGNEVARAMLNVELPKNLEEQLNRLNKPHGNASKSLNKLAPDKRRKTALAPEIQKQLRRVQRAYRKKGAEYGLPTTAKYRWNVEHFGEAEAQRLLNQAERYAKGLAYDENITLLIAKLENKNVAVANLIGKSTSDTSLYPVIERIKAYPREKFTEDKLTNILNSFYTLEQELKLVSELNIPEADKETNIDVAVNSFANAVQSILS